MLQSPVVRDSFVKDCLPPARDCPEFRFDLPELCYPERLNAAVELLDRAIEEGHGADIAIVSDRENISYAELRDLTDRIARILVEREGLVPGNRVLLRGPNCAMLYAAWFGVLKAGGVVVSTMPLLRAGEIARIIERGAISHAIVDDRHLADFATAAGGIVSLLTYHGDLGGGQLEALVAEAPQGFTPVDTGRDDPALIAFTSGTTGNPKGCVQFHRDILACADAFARHILRPQPGDVHCGSPPIAFTFGLGGLLIFPFRFRGSTVPIEAATPAALLDAIERHRVTTLYTAPTAYKAMLPMLGGRDLGSLRNCVSAGEHLPAKAWHDWREATGICLIDGIGATEMMHIFISASGDAIRPGATGRAVPGYVACILDDEGRPLREGTGRLAVKGPTGCRYLDDARQRIYVRDGWNVTGDTYRLDADGYFHYVARSDDIIVSSGYNISPVEVEEALASHPAVAECGVAGAPCEARGQIVKAYVVLASGTESSEALVEELQAHVKQTIAPYKYPRAIAFVEALPRAATGKLQRFALRRMEADHE